METKELINGIIDLTSENEKLKLELEKLQSEQSNEQESVRPVLDDDSMFLLKILKRILLREIWDFSNLKGKIANYEHIGSYWNDDPNERYEYKEFTKEEYLANINYKDLSSNSYTTELLNSLSFEKIKGIYLKDLSAFYDENEKNRKESTKQYVDEQNAEIQEKLKNKKEENKDA